jgi:hypothetical protein
MTAHVPLETGLWMLFWNSDPPADGHSLPGELTVCFDDLVVAAKAKSMGSGSGFFLLYAVSSTNKIVHEAVVAAADLLQTGKAMASTARYLPIKAAGGTARIFVRYLGSQI